MNKLRFNRKKILKIFLVIAVFYAIKLFVDWLLFKGEPSLFYDEVKEKFYIKVNSIKYGSHHKENNRREHSEFYLIDEGTFGDDSISSSDSNRQLLQIQSATLAYSKILIENWVDLFESVLNLGLNTIEVDIPWNKHEPLEKNYEFNQNSHDLEAFLGLARSYGLFVIVRIDPYIHCSTYDMGGLPSWLLAERDYTENILNLKDLKFMSAFKNYLNKLLPILARNQLVKNGPVIGILVQNYNIYSNMKNFLASFYNDEYIKFIEELLDDHQIVEILLRKISTCEGNYSNKTKCDANLFTYLPIKSTLNNKLYLIPHQSLVQIDLNCFAKYFNKENEYVDMNSMYKQNINSLIEFKSNLMDIVQLKRSFNLNSFYCKTNFGFDNAAHHSSKGFLALSTSYISSFYDCLIDENGDLTDKYWLAYKVLKYGSIKLNKKFVFELFNQTYLLAKYDRNKPIKFDTNSLTGKDLVKVEPSHFLPYKKISESLESPLNLKKDKNELFVEYLNFHYKVQTSNQGFILYRWNDMNLRKNEDTIIVEPYYLRDYSILICDEDKHLLTINHQSQGDLNKTISLKLNHDCNKLDVLVENMGRFSDIREKDEFFMQRKGMLVKYAIGIRKKNSKNLEIGGSKWKINFLDFMPKFFNRIHLNSKWIESSRHSLSTKTPFMAYFSFQVNKLSKEVEILKNPALSPDKGVYFLTHPSFSKGVAFINGFNLGKYWTTKGPLITLFVPHFLINNGRNELILFELEPKQNSSSFCIHLVKKHYKL